MTAVDFITILFCRIDEELGHLPNHRQGRLHPRPVGTQIVTLALLYSLKDVGQRTFSRFLITCA
jgi:hypothetical protein